MRIKIRQLAAAVIIAFFLGQTEGRAVSAGFIEGGRGEVI